MTTRYTIRAINASDPRRKTRYVVLDNAKRGRMAFGPFDRRESAEAMVAHAERSERRAS